MNLLKKTLNIEFLKISENKYFKAIIKYQKTSTSNIIL